MTLMAAASTLCLQPLPFPVHVPQGFERFSMTDDNGSPPPLTADEVARIILGNKTEEFGVRSLGYCEAARCREHHKVFGEAWAVTGWTGHILEI